MFLLSLDPISTQGIITLVVPILSLITGWLLATAVERYKGRIVYLRQKQVIQHIALSGQTLGGHVEILFNGKPSNSLFNGSLELTNTTNRDLDDFTVHLSVSAPAAILHFSAQMVEDGITKGLLLEERFLESTRAMQYELADERERTEQEHTTLVRNLDYVFRNKIFSVPVLNRGAKLEFTFLIDCSQGGPVLLATVQKKGVKIISEIDDDRRRKWNVFWVCTLSLIFYALTIHPVIKYSPTPKVAVWATIISSGVSMILAFPAYTMINWLVQRIRKPQFH